MKVLRIGTDEHGLLTEALGVLEERPLSWCVEHQIPWVTPHKDLPQDAGAQWLTSSPLPYFREFFGYPPIESAEIDAEEQGIYNIGIKIPRLIVDQLLIRLVHKRSRYFFVDVEDFGVLAEFEDKDGLFGEESSLVEETNKSKIIVLPKHFLGDLVTEVNGMSYAHFSFKDARRGVSETLFGKKTTRHDPHDQMKFVELRFWKNAGRIERLDSADGTCVLDIQKGSMHVVRADGWTPFPQGVSLVEESDIQAPVVFAYPVQELDVDITISTPLANLDETMVPRTHLQGSTTVAYLETYVSKRLGSKGRGSKGLAQDLAAFLALHEADVLKALTPPRMVVAGESGDEAKSWAGEAGSTMAIPKPSDLDDVNEALKDIRDPREPLVSDLLVNMLARAVVLMHLRNTCVLDPTYVSSMFTYESLLASLLRARPDDKQHYLTPFLMIAPLTQQRKLVTTRKVVTGGSSASPMIGDKDAGW